MTKGEFFPGLYGIIAVLMGPGSMAFHATMVTLGGWLDLVSMFLFSCFLVAYDFARALRKWTRIPGWAEILAFTLLYLVHVGILAGVVWAEKQKPDGGAATLIFILSGVGTGVIDMILILTVLKRNRFFLWASGRLFVLALLVWIASKGVLLPCNPTTFFQWHAWWHVLAAVFVGWVYLYLRTEEEGVKAWA